MRALPILALIAFLTTQSGCFVSQTASYGGMGSVTVSDTNRATIIEAAQAVFPSYGYEPGPANFPESISFDKPAGAAGQIAYGSYGETTTLRATITLTPIPGTDDVRMSPSVYSVSDAGQAGFEDPTRRSQLFALEFKPILEKIRARAAGVGPM